MNSTIKYQATGHQVPGSQHIKMCTCTEGNMVKTAPLLLQRSTFNGEENMEIHNNYTLTIQLIVYYYTIYCTSVCAACPHAPGTQSNETTLPAKLAVQQQRK